MPAEPERFDYYEATTLEPFQDLTRAQLEVMVITLRKEKEIVVAERKRERGEGK